MNYATVILSKVAAPALLLPDSINSENDVLQLIGGYAGEDLLTDYISEHRSIV